MFGRAHTSEKANNQLKFAVIYFHQHSPGDSCILHMVLMDDTQYAGTIWGIPINISTACNTGQQK